MLRGVLSGQRQGEFIGSPGATRIRVRLLAVASASRVSAAVEGKHGRGGLSTPEVVLVFSKPRNGSLQQLLNERCAKRTNDAFPN